MTQAQSRPMTRSLVPLSEEPLPVYLLRLAYRIGRPPGRVAELCGISGGRQRRLAAGHLLVLPSQVAATFARSSSLSASEVRSLGLKPNASIYAALQVHRGHNSGGRHRRRGVMRPPLLARSLAPLPEESLPGILFTAGSPPGPIPPAGSPACAGWPVRAPATAYHLIDLPDDVAAPFSAATRLSPAKVHDLTRTQPALNWNAGSDLRTEMPNWATSAAVPQRNLVH